MQGNAASVQFVKATKESVLSFLNEARKRVVIAKGEDVAGSLLRQIEGEPINIERMNIAIQTCPVIQKAPEEIKQEIATTISVLKEREPAG